MKDVCFWVLGQIMSAILSKSRQLFSEAIYFYYNMFSCIQCSLKYNLNIKNIFLEKQLVSGYAKKDRKMFRNTFF